MPRPAPAFWRALHSLAHPVSLAAVILLLVNDHYLRLYHPSWLTGKLGDFAWLVFAPFIAALFFAWIVPSGVGHAVACPYGRSVGTRHRRVRFEIQLPHESLVGILSFTTIGLWFTLAKTVPAIHALTTTAWENLIDWQGTLRLDPTDLLTLPALLIGWWVWRRSPNTPINLRPLAYVALGLGIVATLASTEPARFVVSDSGITRICQVGIELLTTTEAEPRVEYFRAEGQTSKSMSWTMTPRTNVFVSNDGGLTWNHTVKENYVEPDGICSQKDIAIDPNQPSIQYRWNSGGLVESSLDGGTNWTNDHSIFELSQDIRRFHNHYSTSADKWSEYERQYLESPVSGIVDRNTGNLVLAMSWDGVLARNPSGDWQWVAIGEYQLAEIRNVPHVGNLFFFEIWLAFALAFLIITLSAAYIRQFEIQRLRRIGLCIGWVSWILFSLILPGTKTQLIFGNTPILLLAGTPLISLPGLPLLVAVAIPLSIGAVWDIARNFRQVWRPVALVAIGCGLLYLLPFIPWTQGTIPRYTTALAFALLLATCGLVAGAIHLRKVLPVLPKPEPDTSKPDTPSV